jgi:AcrR family transcriptional regulator
MSPTGTPIRDVRERLFQSAERVLLREGPSGLTSRAVTTEAGLAKGILHRYFPDFDAFLAAMVGARLDVLDERFAALRAAAGAGDVPATIADALGTMLDSVTRALVALVLARRALLERLRVATPSGIPLLAETTRALGAYLTAERGLGRIPADTDVDGLAILLVGGAFVDPAAIPTLARIAKAGGRRGDLARDRVERG